MNEFREQFAAALKGEASPGELLAIVRQHKAHGLSQQTTYDALESIRTELGCSGDRPDLLCEVLEDIMDQVWGFCTQVKAIWDTSLSQAQE